MAAVRLAEVRRELAAWSRKARGNRNLAGSVASVAGRVTLIVRLQPPVANSLRLVASRTVTMRNAEVHRTCGKYTEVVLPRSLVQPCGWITVETVRDGWERSRGIDVTRTMLGTSPGA